VGHRPAAQLTSDHRVAGSSPAGCNALNIKELPLAAPAPGPIARPSASVDPRPRLRQPGGAIRASDPFYIQRDADERVNEIANSTGETLVIKAPRQMGKTSLLNRFIDECDKLGKQWVFVDFQSFTEAELDDYLALLGRLAAQFLRALDFGGDSKPPTFTSQQEFSFFVEDRVIKPVGGPLLFAFDEVDRVLGRPYQREVGLLISGLARGRLARKLSLAMEPSRYQRHCTGPRCG
jgi:hypothetical protein